METEKKTTRRTRVVVTKYGFDVQSAGSGTGGPGTKVGGPLPGGEEVVGLVGPRKVPLGIMVSGLLQCGRTPESMGGSLKVWAGRQKMWEDARR